jgi:hypothetical protein
LLGAAHPVGNDPIWGTLTRKMPVNVILLTGSMGCGKTTVLGEASDILLERAAPHAVIDLDAIGTVLLPGDEAQQLEFRNLSAIYGNFVDAGISRVLVAEAIESRDQLERLRQVLGRCQLVVCWLTAALDTMEHRLRLREPGMLQDRFVTRSRMLQEALEAASLEDFTVVNDRRSITDVAHEVLQRAGWIA